MACILLLSFCAILRISSGQYFYDKPEIKFPTGEKFGPSDHFGYDYPKPIIPFEYSKSTKVPTTSLYNIPKPRSSPASFAHSELSSIPKERVSTSTERFLEKNQDSDVGYQYIKPKQQLKLPDKVESSSLGYRYQKPQVPFELPSIRPAAVNTYVANKNENTNAEYQYPSFSPLSSQNKGLNGTKPFATQIVYTEIKSGYQYPRPKLPLLYPQKEVYTRKEGYTYLKPPNPLVIPALTTSSLITEKPISLSTTQIPTNPTYKNEEGYLYSKPDKSFTLPTPTPSSILKTIKPTNIIPKKSKGFIYEIPINPLRTLESSPLTTVKPLNLFTTIKADFSLNKSEQGNKYPKPGNPLIITSSTQPSTKITTTTEKQHISNTTPKTNPSLLSNEYPTFTTQLVILSKEEKLSETKQGYEYPKPSIPFNKNPVVPTNSPNKSDGYSYPKPDIPFERLSEPKQGYEYPKPSIPFKKNLVTPTKSLNKADGYSHPKPAVPFEQRSEPKQGYEHPKPSISFNKNPVVPTKSLNKSDGYSYSKPAVSFEQLSEPKQGYEYPKPSIPFNKNTVISSKSTNEANGYSYPKPIVSFEPGQKNEIPRETISGYKYPEPSISFEF